jgi:transcription antitermination factor NusG
MYINNVISTRNERLTSGFGMRPNPTGPGTEMHNGADFTDAQRLERTQDVEIIAIADGTVVEVINGSLIGWTAAISHEGKILSRCQHMKNGSLRVKVGDKIKKGQTIGIMGTTGRSTAIHLHLGIKENSTAFNNGTWVDPVPYLTGAKRIGSDHPVNAVQTPVNSVDTPFQKGADVGDAVPSVPPTSVFKPGDKVRVKDVAVGTWGKTYTGGTFRVWHQVYDVVQVSGDRITIGIGSTVTAAVRAADLTR